MRRIIALSLALALLTPAIPAAAATNDTATTHASMPADVIVIYRDQEMTASDFAALGALGAEPADVSVRRPEIALVRVPAGMTAANFARELCAQPGVAAAAPAGTVRALETVPPNDSRYTSSPSSTIPQRTYLGPNADSPHSIDIEPVWDAIYNGSDHVAEPDRAGVTMAVIDSGVSASAMEDPGTIVNTWNYVSDNSDTRDDYYPYYHGTKVASALGAQTGNAYAVAGTLGYTKSTIRVYKVLSSAGTGESINSMVALMDAADDGVKIANVSLGEPATLNGSFTPDPLERSAWQTVIDYCVSRGMLVVAAAGNGADIDNSSPYYPPVWYPAACDGVIAVGAINPETGARSVFSSYGPQLDVVAPGEQVQVVGPSGTTYSGNGTSFASPLVAGALGTLWSLVPDLTPAQVAQLTTATADPSYGTDPAGFDNETGWGRFDAFSMYAEMTSTISTQATVTVTADTPQGLVTHVSWTAAEGSNVRYRYGATGGRAYATTQTSGDVLLPTGGDCTVWVRAYADDRFDSAIATAAATAEAGIAALDATRLEGADRYVTAARISEHAFAGPVTSLVIASGHNWPDGLTASVLAKTGDGPLLLTRKNSLPSITRDEVLRLAPSRIFIVGGTAAVSSAVESRLKSLQYPRAVVIERIGGVDRYDTAAKVATRVKTLKGGTLGGAIVASGYNYPDALSAAPLAARSGWPILLTAPTWLPTTTTSALAAIDAPQTLLIGGTAAIDDTVAQDLGGVTRLSGANRYETSRAVTEWGLTHAVLDQSLVGFATGLSFPDALAAGPALAQSSGGLLLTDPLDTGLFPWLEGRSASVDAMQLFGGPKAVSYETEMALGQALR